MKLYATIENEIGKIEGVGDSNKLIIRLKRGNKQVGYIVYVFNGIRIMAEGIDDWIDLKGSEVVLLKSEKLKGEDIDKNCDGHSENCTCPACCSIS